MDKFSHVYNIGIMKTLTQKEIYKNRLESIKNGLNNWCLKSKNINPKIISTSLIATIRSILDIDFCKKNLSDLSNTETQQLLNKLHQHERKKYDELLNEIGLETVGYFFTSLTKDKLIALLNYSVKLHKSNLNKVIADLKRYNPHSDFINKLKSTQTVEKELKQIEVDIKRDKQYIENTIRKDLENADKSDANRIILNAMKSNDSIIMASVSQSHANSIVLPMIDMFKTIEKNINNPGSQSYMLIFNKECSASPTHTKLDTNSFTMTYPKKITILYRTNPVANIDVTFNYTVKINPIEESALDKQFYKSIVFNELIIDDVRSISL